MVGHWRLLFFFVSLGAHRLLSPFFLLLSTCVLMFDSITHLRLSHGFVSCS